MTGDRERCPADWGSGTESQRCTWLSGHGAVHRDRLGREWTDGTTPPAEGARPSVRRTSAGISGRSEPRPGAGVPPVTHELMFYERVILGEIPDATRLREVYVTCGCTAFHHTLEAGYTRSDLARLAANHSGIAVPSRRACVLCGSADEPMAVILVRDTGTGERHEEWRCEDVPECKLRRFPALTGLLPENPEATA